MASSTTMPKAIINPNNEIIFIDWPEKNMTPNVAKNAIGMPNATHIAVFQARKTNKTIKTIINPEIPFLTNKDILSLIKFEAVYCKSLPQ